MLREIMHADDLDFLMCVINFIFGNVSDSESGLDECRGE